MKETGAGTGLSSCIWQGLGISIPPDWEILRFRKDYRSGFLLWADRYGYRFQLSWQRQSSARNAREVCTDFLGKSSLAGEGDSSRRVKDRIWEGVESRKEDRTEQRFFNILPRERCLLEAVVVDKNRVKAKLMDEILDSVTDVPPGEQGEQAWRGFGMDFEVPYEFEIHKCSVLPGSTTIDFVEGGEQPSELTYCRMGMVAHWMRGGLENWWESQWQKRLTKVVHSNFVNKDGIDILVEERHLKPEGAFGKLRRTRRLFSCLWIDSRDGRFYRHSFQRIGKSLEMDFSKVGSLSGGSGFTTKGIMEEVFHGEG